MKRVRTRPAAMERRARALPAIALGLLAAQACTVAATATNTTTTTATAAAAAAATPATAATAPSGPGAAPQVHHRAFGPVRLLRPAAAPTAVVIVVSATGGWNADALELARRYAAQGALAIGVDARSYAAKSRAAPQGAHRLAIDFEALAHDLEKQCGVPAYLLPWLAGTGDGERLATAVLADAPRGTFAAALAPARLPPREVGEAAPLPNLPLVEVPASPATHHPALAVMLSGDGGWAGLDQDVAAALSRQGVPVVGWSSLRYFWSAREPAAAAADLARVIEHYVANWQRHDVVLLGYSFGAEVLPFLVNRLPAGARSHVRALVLIAPSTTASFEVHVSDWLPGPDGGGLPTLPEARQLGALPVLCLHGRSDHDSLCDRITAPLWQSVELGGGHHFGGDYEGLAARVLRFVAS
ncbi:MAG: AcvB/VirJ family lysyl-phosphatidylglycerol hydrolase [Steroidobacteraceae bacterium]